MTQNQFREAFKRGLGSALLELKNNENRGIYKDTVLWCCLHNTCYDMQCEGDRSGYLYTAIEYFEDKIDFKKTVVNKYKQKKIDTWVFDQLTGLLYEFAVHGSEEAKEALYQKLDSLYGLLFERYKNENVIWTERDEFERVCVCLTSLDGFKAFKYIVSMVGDYYKKQKGRFDLYLDWFYFNSKDKFGKKKVDDYFTKKTSESEGIEKFYKEVKAFDEKPRGSRREVQTLEEYINSCSVKERGYGRARFFVKNATEDELNELAKRAIIENDIEIRSAMLRPFRFKKFPLDEKYIFELTESEFEQVKDNAFEILEKMPSDSVHDYAVKLLNVGKELNIAIRLLCKNYRRSDEQLLLKNIRKLKVNYYTGDWHWEYMAVTDLYNESKVKPNPELLIYIYHKNLCSSCRYKIVKTLHKLKALPREILEECLYDSYAKTRIFAKRILRNYK